MYSKSFRTSIFIFLLLVTTQSRSQGCEFFCLEPVADDTPTDVLVKEGLLSLRAARLFVTEYHLLNDRWPSKKEAIEITPRTKSDNYTVVIGNNGKITIKYSKSSILHGAIFTATPAVPDPPEVIWSCKTKGIDPKYLLPTCNEIYLTTQSRGPT